MPNPTHPKNTDAINGRYLPKKYGGRNIPVKIMEVMNGQKGIMHIAEFLKQDKSYAQLMVEGELWEVLQVNWKKKHCHSSWWTR